MLLYKYIPANTLKYVLQQDCISFKFTPANQFNDPFETYGVSLLSEDENSLYHLVLRYTLNASISSLCLSSSPLDVLMWSHYAKHHEGYVIGIDTEEAGFEDDSFCLVTASEGRIDYLPERNKKPLIVTDENIKSKKVIKALYFNKSIHWKYEREVRVIIDNEHLIPSEDGEYYLYKTKKTSAVKEIYIGINNQSFPECISENNDIKNIIMNNSVNVFQCVFKTGTWDLDKTDYDLSLITATDYDGSDALYRVLLAFEKNKI